MSGPSSSFNPAMLAPIWRFWRRRHRGGVLPSGQLVPELVAGDLLAAATLASLAVSALLSGKA